MRILLAHNSLYYPSHGGGDKSNRLLMEALAERGHEVRVVTRVENFGDADHEKLLRELQSSQGTVFFADTANAPSALSQGAELELVWKSSSHLTLQGGVGLLATASVFTSNGTANSVPAAA